MSSSCVVASCSCYLLQPSTYFRWLMCNPATPCCRYHVICSLFTGNVLGHKTDIADGSLRAWEFR